MVDFRQKHFIKELEKLRQEPLHHIEFLDETVQNIAHFVSDDVRIQAKYNIPLQAFTIEAVAEDEAEAVEIAELIEEYKQNKTRYKSTV